MSEEILEEVKSTIEIFYEMIKEAKHEVIYVGKSDLKWLLDYTTNLEKRNQEIYEGFIATQEELTEYATKNERLHSIIKEVREWANKTIFYFDFEEEITKHAFDLLYTKQGQELLEILDRK